MAMEEGCLFAEFGSFSEQRLDIRDIVDQTRHLFFIAQPFFKLIVFLNKIFRWHNIPATLLTFLLINIFTLESDTRDVLTLLLGAYLLVCVIGLLHLKHRLLSKVLPSIDHDAEYNNVTQLQNMKDFRIILAVLERSIKHTNQTILKLYSLLKWQQQPSSILTYTFLLFSSTLLTILPLRIFVLIIINALLALEPLKHVIDSLKTQHVDKTSRSDVISSAYDDDPTENIADVDNTLDTDSESSNILDDNDDDFLEVRALDEVAKSKVERTASLKPPTTDHQPHLRRRVAATVSSDDKFHDSQCNFRKMDSKVVVVVSNNNTPNNPYPNNTYPNNTYPNNRNNIDNHNNNSTIHSNNTHEESHYNDDDNFKPHSTLDLPPMPKALSTPSLVASVEEHATLPLHHTTTTTSTTTTTTTTTTLSKPTTTTTSSPRLSIKSLLNKNTTATTTASHTTSTSPTTPTNFLSIQKNLINQKVPAIVDRLIEFKKRAKNNPAGVSERCRGCEVAFTAIFKRRHVCNCCGHHFCWKCCCQKVPRAKFGATAPAAQTETVAVCMSCLHKLVENKDTVSPKKKMAADCNVFADAKNSKGFEDINSNNNGGGGGENDGDGDGNNDDDSDKNNDDNIIDDDKNINVDNKINIDNKNSNNNNINIINNIDNRNNAMTTGTNDSEDKDLSVKGHLINSLEIQGDNEGDDLNDKLNFVEGDRLIDENLSEICGSVLVYGKSHSESLSVDNDPINAFEGFKNNNNLNINASSNTNTATSTTITTAATTTSTTNTVTNTTVTTFTTATNTTITTTIIFNATNNATITCTTTSATTATATATLTTNTSDRNDGFGK